MSSSIRPRTAPASGRRRKTSFAEKTSKPMRLSIRDIMNGGGSGGNVGKPGAIEQQLKDKTLGLLDCKKKELDKLMCKLGDRRRKLRELDAMYTDLVRNGKALGLHEFKEKDRLRPVRCVSTKPIFSGHHKSIEKLEKQLANSSNKLSNLLNQQKVYEFMLTRYKNQSLETGKQTLKLQRDIREAEQQHAELEKRKLLCENSTGVAHTKLQKRRETIREDLHLWEKEIERCKEMLEKQRRTAEMYEKVLEEQRNLEKKNAGFLSEQETKTAKQVEVFSRVGKNLSRRATSKVIFDKRAEEERYISAFVKVGMKVQELSPSAVLKTCLAQAELRKDLSTRAEETEAKQGRLRDALKKAQQDLNATLFTPPREERATHRVVAEHEKTLRELEKSLEQIKDRYSYLESTVRPVRIGLLHLEKKLLLQTNKLEPHPAGSIEEGHDEEKESRSDCPKFSEMLQQIQFLIKTTNAMVKDCNNDQRVESSLVALSSYNVRVRTNVDISFAMVTPAQEMETLPITPPVSPVHSDEKADATNDTVDEDLLLFGAEGGSNANEEEEEEEEDESDMSQKRTAMKKQATSVYNRHQKRLQRVSVAPGFATYKVDEKLRRKSSTVSKSKPVSFKSKKKKKASVSSFSIKR